MLDSVMIRLLFPAAALGFTAWTQAKSLGLFNVWSTHPVISIALSAVLLDLALYGQHRVFHRMTALWRIHRVHHADVELDVTTGTRFHPLEILLSMGIKCVVIAVLGAPVIAVFLFEVLLNLTSVFNHANVRLPTRLDAVLRSIVVTPDMHLVHHSRRSEETNSNFGFCFSAWDRVFGTYHSKAGVALVALEVGVEGYSGTPNASRLSGMLAMPFRP